MSRRNWYLLTNSLVLFWMVMSVVAVFVHRFVSQPLWLMVHLPLLGAATAAILIWSQHFADTLLRRSAPAGRTGLAARLALHTLGAAFVVTGVVVSLLPLTVTGAALVATAVVAHAVILILQLRRALPARFAPLVRYYIAAGFVFLAGIAIGVTMPAVTDPAATDRLVVSHLVLNAFGWIGLTALGTLVLLWPTVLHARMSDAVDVAARRALPLLTAGLLLAAAGPITGVRPLVAAGMLVWLSGAGMIAVQGWRLHRAGLF